MNVSSGRIEVEVDAAVRALDRVEHIVVLMMENRSYDQMLVDDLTLLVLRPQLDGLKADMVNVYRDRSGKFPPAPMGPSSASTSYSIPG